MSVLDHAPNSVLKRLARLPVVLYRLNLGRLLGHRFLVIVHEGRRSARIYSTVVEVIHWDSERAEAVVASGWGERANWYRNLRATPAREVLIAGERFRPSQRFLDLDERITTLRAYQRQHPRLTGVVGKLLGLPDPGNDLHAIASRLPMVAFRRTTSNPPR